MKKTTLILVLTLATAAAAQTAMWGGSPGRNQVSDEKNLPATWDVDSGENVLWSATLGSQTYGGPLIHGDKIFVGTNNQSERDPDHKGDRGVIMVAHGPPYGILDLVQSADEGTDPVGPGSAWAALPDYEQREIMATLVDEVVIERRAKPSVDIEGRVTITLATESNVTELSMRTASERRASRATKVA